MNKIKHVLKPSKAVLGAVILALLMVAVVYADIVNIDSFNDGAQLLTVYISSPYAGHAVDTTAAIGGERDTVLEWLSGNTSVIDLRIDFLDSNRFAYTAGDDMMGRVWVTWDGNDSDAVNFDHQGLANVDLSDESTNDGILASIINADQRSRLTFRVYADTPAANWSYLTLALPPLNPGSRMDAFFPFADFQVAGGTGADFQNVGGMVMILDGNVDASVDVSIDLVEATSVREYGDLPDATPPSGYGTNMLNANHIPQGLRLGVNADAEAAYNTNAGATADDANQVDDEDGVQPTNTPWAAGTNGGQVTINIRGCLNVGGCYVNGWLDWNQDGSFDDTVNGASEYIVPNVNRTNDDTLVQSFNTPTNFSTGNYYARFRICRTSTACDSPDNTDTNVRDGEVEDYYWLLSPTAVRVVSFAATPDAGSVRLDWETATEVDNLGFNLYRATDSIAMPEQLNGVMIPSKSPGSQSGAVYTYLDKTAVPGVTYYYWLDDVDVNGVATRHGPVWAAAGAPGSHRIFLPLIVK